MTLQHLSEATIMQDLTEFYHFKNPPSSFFLGSNGLINRKGDDTLALLK